MMAISYEINIRKIAAICSESRGYHFHSFNSIIKINLENRDFFSLLCMYRVPPNVYRLTLTQIKVNFKMLL